MQITANNYTTSSQMGIEGIKIVTKENGQGTEEVKGQEQQDREAASVTISQEGRKKLQQSLNENLTELRPTKSAADTGGAPAQQAAAPENRTGQDGMAGFNEMESEPENDPYQAALDNVKDRFESIITSSEKKAKKEDIEEMQRALEDMRRLKQFQADAERQKEKEIREAKAQSGKWRSEVDKDNADLLIMLESFEEYEKKQDELEDKRESEEENRPAASREQEQEPKKMGEVLKDSAARMVGTVIDKEELKNQSIANVENKGLYKLQNAEDEFRNFMDEYENLSRAFAQEGLTEEEKKVLVERYVVKAQGDRFSPGGYLEVEENRTRGLVLRQFARDLRREDRSVQIMPGMQKIKGEMEAAASDALLNSEAQEQLDKAASDVQKRVQDKLEERNDITDKDYGTAEEAKEEEIKEAAEQAAKDLKAQTTEDSEEILLVRQQEEEADYADSQSGK